MEVLQDKLHKLTSEQTRELAEQIGVCPATLFHWRTGNILYGSGLTMFALCSHFGILQGELPDLTEEEKLNLEIRYKMDYKKRMQKRKQKPQQTTFKVHRGGRA